MHRWKLADIHSSPRNNLTQLDGVTPGKRPRIWPPLCSDGEFKSKGILATHTLTGGRSNANKNKFDTEAAKPALDPVKLQEMLGAFIIYAGFFI